MSAEAEATHRAALWLSLMLTVLGSCGGCNGIRLYGAGPVPSRALVESNSEAGSEELAELAVVGARVIIDDPNRKPLSLANVVLSGMLVAGGFLIGIRHRNARWFITNALAANMLWIVADGVADVHRLLHERRPLAAALARAIDATKPEGQAMSQADLWAMAHGWVTTFAVASAGVALLSFGVHGLVLVRMRSPLIQRFLDERPAP